MGQEITTTRFNEDDATRFRARLRAETRLLGDRFAAGDFCDELPLVAGCEIEGWLLDRHYFPVADNEPFLARLGDPLFVPELSRYNIEINCEPVPRCGGAFATLQAALAATWERCQRAAHAGNDVAMLIGILPTLRERDLDLANISPLNRYRALNAQIMRARGGTPIRIDIRGRECLQLGHDDAMLEAGTTSLQLHLQMPAARAVRYYHAAQLLAAPMVAVAANAPFLFGRDLWAETRVPLFVSILLHGNEDSGLRAVQRVLAAHAARGLSRPLSLFIGNVAAARAGLRRLDGQPDYNRVWPGTPDPDLPESRLMAQVVADMARLNPFASVDIHNNTGLNPHYGCVNLLTPATLHLAALFSRIVVYFTRPLGVQSMAFSRLRPAVTVECGKAGSGAGDEHAASLVEAALHLDHFPVQPPRREDLAVYHTVATVKIPPELSFDFGDTDADLCLPASIERWNFVDLPAGTDWGTLRESAPPPEVVAEDGADVVGEYFDLTEGRLRLRRPATPAMLTLDTRVVRQDCLCYLMEHYPLHREAAQEA